MNAYAWPKDVIVSKYSAELLSLLSGYETAAAAKEKKRELRLFDEWCTDAYLAEVQAKEKETDSYRINKLGCR